MKSILANPRRRLGAAAAAVTVVAAVTVLAAPRPTGSSPLLLGLAAVGVVAVTFGWSFGRPWRRAPARTPPELPRSGTAGAAAPAEAVAAPSGERGAAGCEVPASVGSIAVLPFVDMSEQHDLEYFCDGIAEEITDALTHLPGLHVAARTSAFLYKGKELDVRAVGRELGVDALLEGSVRLSGERLRITAQLVSVKDGYHLWSEKYDRTRRDLIAVQEDIARSVVERMYTTLPAAPECCEAVASRVRARGGDPEAYQLYLKGRHYWRKRDKVGLEKGVTAFREAVERDPEYALPYAGLSDAYGTMAWYSLISSDEARQRSGPMIERALALGAGQPEVQHALAMNRYWLHWDFPAAEAAYGEALRLNPRHAESAAYLAQMLGVTGRRDEAVEWAERARRMEPLSPFVLAVASSGLHMAGLYARAAEMAGESLELEEGHLLGSFMLGLNLMGLGREERAEELFRSVVERSARNPFIVSLHAWALGEMGQTDEAWELVHEIEHRVAAGTASWCDLAGAKAGLWDLEGAVRDFGTAARKREVRAVYLRRALPYQMLAEMPPFRELCAAIGV